MKIKKLMQAAYFSIVFLGTIELFNYRGIIGSYLLLDLRFYIAILLAIVACLIARKKIDHDWYLIKFNNHYFLPIVTVLAIILFGIDAYTYPTFVTNNFGLNQAILLDLLIFSYFLKILTSEWEIIKRDWAKLFFFVFLLLCFYIFTYNSEVFIKIGGNFSGADDDNFMEWMQVVALSIGLILSVLLALQKNTEKRQISFLLRIFYIAFIFLFIFLIGEEISWGQRLLNIQVEKSNSYQKELNIHNNEGMNEIFIFLYIFAFIYGFISWRIGKYLKKYKPRQNQHQIAWINLFCFRGQEVLYLVPTFIFNPYADRSMFSKNGPSLLDLYYDSGVLPDFFAALRFLVIWRESFELLFYLALVIHVFNIYLNSTKKI